MTCLRIFFHSNSQSLCRVVTTGVIAVVSANFVFVTSFSHAHFALVSLTDFGAITTFAYGNNLRRFRYILQFNSYGLLYWFSALRRIYLFILARVILCSLAVIDNDIERVHLGIFLIVKLFRQDQQGILHFERIVIGIIEREFAITEFIQMLHIRIIRMDITHRTACYEVFLRVEGKIILGTLIIAVQIFNASNRRSFVHVDNLDDTEERTMHAFRILRITHVNRHIVRIEV